jgi:pSer/pThr/pTyr-binding forkhead associated (FHA) protein
MPFCTQCGHANPDGSRFCSNCGSALRGGTDVTSTLSLHGLDTDLEAGEAADIPALTPADQAAVDALPPGSALLVVRRGPNSGSRFLLDSDVTTAGRHPESDIFLDDVTVSRRHAEFRRTGGSFAVRDVGSLNGTYVNRERIESATLTGGDEVQIGKYRLVFFASHQGSAQAMQTGQGRES